jgi:hypothetical protein
MVTKQQLIDAATAKGAEVIIEKSEFTTKELIGIRLKNKYVYYWFEIQPWETHVSFNHSYSQNTGKTQKSYRAGWVIFRSLKLMD